MTRGRTSRCPSDTVSKAKGCRKFHPSFHSTTHLEILRRFLEIDVQVDREDNGNCLVRFG